MRSKSQALKAIASLQKELEVTPADHHEQRQEALQKIAQLSKLWGIPASPPTHVPKQPPTPTHVPKQPPTQKSKVQNAKSKMQSSSSKP